MKPFKVAQPLASWLVRIIFAFYLFLIYLKGINPVQLNSLNFYLSLTMLVFSVLLVVGGFLKTQTLTVVSAVIVGLILLYKALAPAPTAINAEFAQQALLISIAFLFVCKGNQP